MDNHLAFLSTMFPKQSQVSATMGTAKSSTATVIMDGTAASASTQKVSAMTATSLHRPPKITTAASFGTVQSSTILEDPKGEEEEVNHDDAVDAKNKVNHDGLGEQFSTDATAAACFAAIKNSAVATSTMHKDLVPSFLVTNDLEPHPAMAILASAANNKTNNNKDSSRFRDSSSSSSSSTRFFKRNLLTPRPRTLTPKTTTDNNMSENTATATTAISSSTAGKGASARRRGRSQSRTRTVENQGRRLSIGAAQVKSNSSYSSSENNDSLDTDMATMDGYIQKSSRVQAFLGHAWHHVKHATTTAAAAASNSSNKENHFANGNPENTKKNRSSKNSNKKKRRRRGSSVEQQQNRVGAVLDSTTNKDNGSDAAAVLGENNDEIRDDDNVDVHEEDKDVDDDDDKEDKGSPAFSASTLLLREQTTQLWRLQRQLEQKEKEFAILQSNHETLQQELHSSQSRAQRAQTALRVASENVRTARAQADAAETTAAHLAQQLQELQLVVQETKKATQVLQQEQVQVTKQASRAESALHNKDLELTQARNALKQHKAEHEFFKAAQKAWDRQQQELQAQLSEKTKQVSDLERQQYEKKALAAARLQRLQNLQEEWQHAQTLLEEATQANVTTKQTVVELSAAVTRLQMANSELHERLQKFEASTQEQALQQQEALHKSEKAALQLQIQKEALEDELMRLQQKANKPASSPLTAATALSCPDITEPGVRCSLPALGTFNSNYCKDALPNKPSSVTIKDQPPVPPSKTAATTEAITATVLTATAEYCSLCRGMTYGLMKRCQCGRLSCPKRAHLACANKYTSSSTLSLAHPGTPMQRMPLILCSSADDKNKNNIKESASS